MAPCKRALCLLVRAHYVLAARLLTPKRRAKVFTVTGTSTFLHSSCSPSWENFSTQFPVNTSLVQTSKAPCPPLCRKLRERQFSPSAHCDMSKLQQTKHSTLKSHQYAPVFTFYVVVLLLIILYIHHSLPKLTLKNPLCSHFVKNSMIRVCVPPFFPPSQQAHSHSHTHTLTKHTHKHTNTPLPSTHTNTLTHPHQAHTQTH